MYQNDCLPNDPSIEVPIIIGTYPLQDLPVSTPSATNHVQLNFPCSNALNDSLKNFINIGTTDAIAPVLPFPSNSGLRSIDEEALRSQRNSDGFVPKYTSYSIDL